MDIKNSFISLISKYQDILVNLRKSILKKLKIRAHEKKSVKNQTTVVE